MIALATPTGLPPAARGLSTAQGRGTQPALLASHAVQLQQPAKLLRAAATPGRPLWLDVRLVQHLAVYLRARIGLSDCSHITTPTLKSCRRRPAVTAAASAGGAAAVPPPPAQPLSKLEKLADIATMLFPVWVRPLGWQHAVRASWAAGVCHMHCNLQPSRITPPHASHACVQALISGCTAFFHPASLSWMTHAQFEGGVGLLMLAMGLSLTKEDFKRVGGWGGGGTLCLGAEYAAELG